MTNIRLITKYYKISWNDLPPHQQSSHEADLHLSVESTRSTQPLKKKAAFSSLTRDFGNPSTKTTGPNDSTEIG